MIIVLGVICFIWILSILIAYVLSKYEVGAKYINKILNLEEN